MEAILEAKMIIFMYNLHENSLHTQFFKWGVKVYCSMLSNITKNSVQKLKVTFRRFNVI